MRSMVLIILMIASIFVSPVSSLAYGTGPPSRQMIGTVSGTVLLDGAPLVGVEVWVGEMSGGNVVRSHYDCTDRHGYFEMTNVSLNTGLISATGIEVYLAQPCSNPLFLGPGRGLHRIPLLMQYWDHHSGLGSSDIFMLTAANPTVTLDYDIEPWPIAGFPGLSRRLVQSIRHFHEGDTRLAILTARQFIQRVNQLEARGRLSTPEADSIRAYANHLIYMVYPLRP